MIVSSLMLATVAARRRLHAIAGMIRAAFRTTDGQATYKSSYRSHHPILNDGHVDGRTSYNSSYRGSNGGYGSCMIDSRTTIQPNTPAAARAGYHCTNDGHSSNNDSHASYNSSYHSYHDTHTITYDIQ